MMVIEMLSRLELDAELGWPASGGCMVKPEQAATVSFQLRWI